MSLQVSEFKGISDSVTCGSDALVNQPCEEAGTDEEVGDTIGTNLVLSIAYGVRTVSGHDDFGSFLDVLFRGCETDSASATSDNYNLVCEAARGISPIIRQYSYPVDLLRIWRTASPVPVRS